MKSYDEMRREMEDLLKRSEQLRADSASAMEESDSLRKRSVDIRQLDPEQAEALWIESEELRTKARELMRESVELRIKAADIKHRLDIHEQIESIPDKAEKLWRKAVRG
ncbi:MAG: hypothetical protein QHG98_03325 [Methanothrix sp.]|uniref:hypothetical protein n=1 Tax=Methanothrix sp. TaxID=90426 RepID=UPI00247E0AB7|nr:hypothetical protein [Methanothrix sp.]